MPLFVVFFLSLNVFIVTFKFLNWVHVKVESIWNEVKSEVYFFELHLCKCCESMVYMKTSSLSRDTY